MPRHAFFERRLLAERPRPLDMLNAGLVLAAAFVIRLLLPLELSAAVAPPLYLITVIAAAWVAGTHAAVLACGLGALLMPFPTLRQPPEPWSLVDVASVLLMFGVCLLAIALTASLRRSLRLVVAQRERYARILDSVADAVIVTDEEARLEYYNERAQILFGFDETLLGRPLDSIVHFRAGREAPSFDPLAGVLRGERRGALPDDLEVTTGHATRVPVSGSIASLDTGEGAAHAGHLICLQDVGELRRSLQARRDADAQVSEKQQLMQAIIDEIPAVVAYLDRAGRCVLANRVAVQGGFALRAHDDEAGLQGRRHLLDDDRVAHALRGESVAETVALYDEARRLRHFAVQYQPHRREFPGRIDGAIVHAVDISDGVRRQQALVDSEQRFRRLAEASSAVILHLDARGDVLFEFGWPAFAGPGEAGHVSHLLRAAAAADRAVARRAMARARAGDRKVEVELRLQHADGGWRWIALRIVPLPADERVGPARGRQWIVGIRDVHERRLVELSLLQRSHELEALAESVPHLVWIADAAGAIVYLNRRWSEYTGLADREDWTRAFHDDDRQAVAQGFADAIRSGEGFTAEVRLRAADGAHRWHVLRALPVGEATATRRWYGGFTDIEDQKQAQDVLLRAQSKTQRFLATLSHELRNPLAVIATNAWLLVEGRHADPDGRLAQAIQRQAQHLQRMVDDLLDVSRITQGKIQLRVERFDLNEIVRQACADFAARATAQETTLHAEPAPSPLMVNADLARVRQIADNLLSNALKANRAGGHVHVGARLDGSQRVLVVRDDGRGIPPAIAERMFEPFVQGNDWRERGLGLGLAVVSQLTTLHGGEVRAGRAPEGGASFEIRLPEGTPATAPGAVPAAAPVGAGGRVMVVDDVVDHANALAALLRMSGYEAHAVYSGDEAVRFAQDTQCDAVICDIGLPEPWNGHRVAEFLRRNWSGSPLLIAYSGLGTPADVAASLAAGFDAHLLKPTRPSEILARLHDGLAGRDAA